MRFTFNLKLQILSLIHLRLLSPSRVMWIGTFLMGENQAQKKSQKISPEIKPSLLIKQLTLTTVALFHIWESSKTGLHI